MFHTSTTSNRSPSIAPNPNSTTMSRMPSISSLMSPPESKPLDSFSSSVKSQPPPATSRQQLDDSHCDMSPSKNSSTPENQTIRILLSPPVSPWTKNMDNNDGTSDKVERVAKNAGSIRDPVLYPDHHHEEVIPLFPSSPERLYAEELVNQHMACHMNQFEKKVNQPTRDEYLLALSFVSNVSRAYNNNPGAYLKRVREESDTYYSQAKRICARPGVTSTPSIKIIPAVAPKTARRPTTTVRPPKPPFTRVKRTPKTSPKDQLLELSDVGRSATPEVRVTGQKRPEDVDYSILPDFCPSLTTLPAGNPKVLKTDWASNNPLNLSNDPDRHMLHEAEINLASTLRLSCATYLCSKRRIFEGRVKAFRIGREFRKTDAQQACKIDVNKASKLWMAYDKVGWFNRAHFQQHLQ